jgi:hypothetical protein
MRRPTVLRCLPALGLAAALAACADDAPPDDTTYNCEVDERDEPFAINLARTGAGGTTFTIVAADPALPIPRQQTRGSSTSAAAARRCRPADGVFVVTPFMPDHRHGTGIKATLDRRSGGAGGASRSARSTCGCRACGGDLRGDADRGARDQVTFTFCITG